MVGPGILEILIVAIVLGLFILIAAGITVLIIAINAEKKRDRERDNQPSNPPADPPHS